MLSRRWYRGLRVMFGALSFVKEDPDHGPTYAVVWGRSKDIMIPKLLDMGFKQEWANNA